MNQNSYPYISFIPNYQNIPGTNNNYDLIDRIERLEREIKRLESRVYHLEKNEKNEFTSTSKEYIQEDDGLYMV